MAVCQEKHPSSIFGGYEGIFKKRMHWDKDASAKDRRKYHTQPKYYDEVLQNIDDIKLVEKNCNSYLEKTLKQEMSSKQSFLISI